MLGNQLFRTSFIVSLYKNTLLCYNVTARQLIIA